MASGEKNSQFSAFLTPVSVRLCHHLFWDSRISLAEEVSHHRLLTRLLSDPWKREGGIEGTCEERGEGRGEGRGERRGERRGEGRGKGSVKGGVRGGPLGVREGVREVVKEGVRGGVRGGVREGLRVQFGDCFPPGIG